MANFLFDSAREKFLKGELSWTTNNFKVCLLSSAYNPQITHQTMNDIPSQTRVAVSEDLTGKDAVGGTARANDVELSGVPNKVIKAIVIFKVESTLEASPLIAYIDTAGGLDDSGLTPTSGIVKIEWKRAKIGDTKGEIFKL